MKCPKCNAENKNDAKICKKCGTQIIVEPLWKPSWKWHVKTLAIIYVFLIILFFLLNWLLKPYMRQLPKDVTPWLNKEVKEGVK
ncbi:MAG: hypothetical protein AUJ85_05220 [Elusimicrobia bacterium CG1_02_37_114]|nr:MAG: hypothetical protein AUJ85_05220 [Elusimicrobia bacterium CG1_02_37_114]PIZ13523.1 MAG: hypothetical protein COY53_04340 [Elusimicrobia bacterium CG_4_10_14_0_8_um_filter_37_32]